MKHAILLVAGLLASISVAATVNCYPADIGGAGSFAVVGETLNDRYAGWKCPAIDTTPAVEVYYVLHKKNALKHPAVTNFSYSAVLNAYLNLNVKKDVFLPEFAEALAALKHDMKYASIPAKTLQPTVVPQAKARSAYVGGQLSVLNPAGVRTPVYSAANMIQYAPDNNPVFSSENK